MNEGNKLKHISSTTLLDEILRREKGETSAADSVARAVDKAFALIEENPGHNFCDGTTHIEGLEDAVVSARIHLSRARKLLSQAKATKEHQIKVLNAMKEELL